MNPRLRNLIVCAVAACAGRALAHPEPPAAAPAKRAAPRSSGPEVLKPSTRVWHKTSAALAQYRGGNYQRALELIEEGLAVAPKHLALLNLQGTVLLELRDYPGALAAYQAYLAAGPHGANRREAEKIVHSLRAVESTFLELSLASGPGEVYLDSKTAGRFCLAAPTCHRAVLPGEYKVIVERPGFDRFSQQLQIRPGQTAQLAVTLVEKPSLLTARVAPGGASVVLDGAAHDPARPIPAGKHQIVVSLAGHAPEQREIIAREGAPIELDVVLSPIVAVLVEPPGAALLLDGKPVAIQDGGIPIPQGAHNLVVRAAGFQDRQIAIPAERGADFEVTAKLEPVVVMAPRPPPSPPLPSRPGRFTGRRKLALAMGGAGVVGLGAGALLGLQARRLDADTYAVCEATAIPCVEAPEANDLNRRARARARDANLAYGAAGGAAIAAAILWLTGAPERRVAVTPRLGGGAGVDLAVRF